MIALRAQYGHSASLSHHGKVCDHDPGRTVGNESAECPTAKLQWAVPECGSIVLRVSQNARMSVLDADFTQRSEKRWT